MLALSRRTGEGLIIDGNIEIKVLEIQGDKVKIGIQAPKEIGIYREEIYAQIKLTNEEAASMEKMDLAHANEFMNKLKIKKENK